jgi:hypothetical protein
MCVVAKLRAVDVISSHQFEEEIGAASSENGFFIANIEFSIRTGVNNPTWRPKKTGGDLRQIIQLDQHLRSGISTAGAALNHRPGRTSCEAISIFLT